MKAQSAEQSVGQKFGRLLILRYVGIRQSPQKDRIRNKYIVECQCDCGKIVQICISNIKCGETTSCGCYRNEQNKKGHERQRGVARPHMQKPNGQSILHSSFLQYKRAARDRGLEFNLSEMEFEKLTARNCYYCGAIPVEKHKPREHASRKLNGVDRIDSSMGYKTDNCVTCCKRCNYLKHVMSYSEMIEHLRKILELHDGRMEECALEKQKQIAW